MSILLVYLLLLLFFLKYFALAAIRRLLQNSWPIKIQFLIKKKKSQTNRNICYLLFSSFNKTWLTKLCKFPKNDNCFWMLMYICSKFCSNKQIQTLWQFSMKKFYMYMHVFYVFFYFLFLCFVFVCLFFFDNHYFGSD